MRIVRDNLLKMHIREVKKDERSILYRHNYPSRILKNTIIDRCKDERTITVHPIKLNDEELICYFNNFRLL